METRLYTRLSLLMTNKNAFINKATHLWNEKVTIGDKIVHTLKYTDNNQECIYKQSYAHLK